MNTIFDGSSKPSKELGDEDLGQRDSEDYATKLEELDLPDEISKEAAQRSIDSGTFGQFKRISGDRGLFGTFLCPPLG